MHPFPVGENGHSSSASESSVAVIVSDGSDENLTLESGSRVPPGGLRKSVELGPSGGAKFRQGELRTSLALEPSGGTASFPDERHKAPKF